MCIVSSPKPPPAPEPKDPEYLRNPFLDVASNDKRNASSIRIGRNALRVSNEQDPTVGFSGRTTSGAGQSALTRSQSRGPGGGSLGSTPRGGTGETPNRGHPGWKDQPLRINHR